MHSLRRVSSENRWSSNTDGRCFSNKKRQKKRVCCFLFCFYFLVTIKLLYRDKALRPRSLCYNFPGIRGRPSGLSPAAAALERCMIRQPGRDIYTVRRHKCQDIQHTRQRGRGGKVCRRIQTFHSVMRRKSDRKVHELRCRR